MLNSNCTLLNLYLADPANAGMLSSRNRALASLNFSSNSYASHSPRYVVAFGQDSGDICSLLGGALASSPVDSISDLLRSSVSVSPNNCERLLHRPDPSLLVDLVAEDEEGNFVASAPIRPPASHCGIPIVAHSLLEARTLLSPTSTLVLSVRLDDINDLHLLAQQCAPFQHIVCYSGANNDGDEEAIHRLRSAFPSALSVVPVSDIVAAVPPPPSIPTTWLLLHRELLRSDRAILSWDEATALARRCNITHPDAISSALAQSPSFVLPNECVVPFPLLDALRHKFDPAPDLHSLPISRLRSAVPRLRRSLITSTDIVHTPTTSSSSSAPHRTRRPTSPYTPFSFASPTSSRWWTRAPTAGYTSNTTATATPRGPIRLVLFSFIRMRLPWRRSLPFAIFYNK